MEDQREGKLKNRAAISRRKFLKVTGKATLAAGVLPNFIWLDDAIAAIPASEGYLLVDTKKCQGFLSCMLACSLVHEGTENLSQKERGTLLTELSNSGKKSEINF